MGEGFAVEAVVEVGGVASRVEVARHGKTDGLELGGRNLDTCHLLAVHMGDGLGVVGELDVLFREDEVGRTVWAKTAVQRYARTF